MCSIVATDQGFEQSGGVLLARDAKIRILFVLEPLLTAYTQIIVDTQHSIRIAMNRREKFVNIDRDPLRVTLSLVAVDRKSLGLVPGVPFGIIRPKGKHLK